MAQLDCTPLKSEDTSRKSAVHFTPPSVLEPLSPNTCSYYFCTCVEYSRFKFCKVKCSRNPSDWLREISKISIHVISVYRTILPFDWSKGYFIVQFIGWRKPSHVLRTVLTFTPYIIFFSSAIAQLIIIGITVLHSSISSCIQTVTKIAQISQWLLNWE